MRLNHLCSAVGISLLTRPLKALESEYLLRIQDEQGDASVVGLHVLRSKAVVNALFADSPDLWKEYAVRVLPLLVDEDIESFLLAVFSRRGEFSNLLFEHIRNLSPRSWTHDACIVRSLIWEGVNRYERTNRDTILAAMAKFDGGWWFACDSFVGMDGDGHQKLLTTLNDTLNTQIQPIPLTPKTAIFELLATWASAVLPPVTPQSPRDWASVGDVAHWLAHAKVTGPLRTSIEVLLPSSIQTALHVDELGSYISGRAQFGDASFLQWHDTELPRIRNVFVSETDSVHVSDDGHEVKVFYSVRLADSVTSGMPDANDWNAQTMKRVRFLRLLFPNRETFSGQGLGLELLVGELGHDPTFKCIPAKSLPLERSVRLNATFGGLVAYRHNRTDTWKEYISAVVAFREAVSSCFRKLHRGWAKLLSESSPRQTTINGLPGAEIDQVKKLSKLPMFPRSAVDEWGFLSEEKQAENKTGETMQERSLRRFDLWRKAFRDFESGVGMVVSKIVDITVLYVAEHKGHVASDDEEKAGHLMLVNLGAAWEALRGMQREFRKHFGQSFRAKLDELEENERSNFRHLWPVAFAMHHERHRHFSHTGLMGKAETERRKVRFLQVLKTEIETFLGESGTVTVPREPWVLEETPHLCIVCDYRSLTAMEASRPKLVEAVWRAAQSGGWRVLEWKPLEIEWPKMAFVSLVLGKALAPACATVSTLTLFAATESFEAKFHHYAMQPVTLEDFARGRFLLWENPLLRSALGLQGNVLAFVLTHSRFQQLANLAFAQGLDQEAVDRILARYSKELRTVLTVAQRSYADTSQILSTLAEPDKSKWQTDLARLCRSLLLEVDETADVSITPERFAGWLGAFPNANDAFQKLVSEILRSALAVHGEPA